MTSVNPGDWVASHNTILSGGNRWYVHRTHGMNELMSVMVPVMERRCGRDLHGVTTGVRSKMDKVSPPWLLLVGKFLGIF